MSWEVEAMLDGLKLYLEKEGISNIYLDLMPHVDNGVEAVNLVEWDNVIPTGGNDGTSTHYVQVQVRRSSYDDAKRDCKKILGLLDSGTDERLIWLTDDMCCICRPRRGAVILERGEGYTTFYCELVIWADN